MPNKDFTFISENRPFTQSMWIWEDPRCHHRDKSLPLAAAAPTGPDETAAEGPGRSDYGVRATRASPHPCVVCSMLKESFAVFAGSALCIVARRNTFLYRVLPGHSSTSKLINLIEQRIPGCSCTQARITEFTWNHKITPEKIAKTIDGRGARQTFPKRTSPILSHVVHPMWNHGGWWGLHFVLRRINSLGQTTE